MRCRCKFQPWVSSVSTISKEIEPPYGFHFDTSPSPLHPALQVDVLGVNPFRSARAWRVSEMRTAGNPSRVEAETLVPCSLLQTSADPSPEFDEASGRSNAWGERSSICTAATGNLGSSLLAACMEDAWLSTALNAWSFDYLVDVC